MEGIPTVQILGLRMSRQARANFRWDFIAAALFSLFNVVFNQFYVPIAIRSGATDFQVGLLSAAPAVGLLFSPIWAGLAERGRAKYFVTFPNMVGRLLIFIPALFASPWVFVGIALVYQFLQGIQAPAYATLMTQIYPADIRGRIMGYVRVAMGLLMIPLAFTVGIWIDRAGSFYPLLIAAVTGSASMLIFSMVKEERLPDPQAAARKRVRFRDQFTVLSNNRPLVLFLVATTFSGFGNMLANPLYNIIQVQRLGLSNMDIGIVRIFYFVFLLTAYFFMGRVIDRYGPKRAMIFCIGCHVLCTLLYGVFGTYPAVLLASGMQGFADATWDLGCLAYVFRLAPGKEGVVFGLHLMLFGIRGTIGPLLGTGLNGVLPIEAIILAASFFCLCGFLTLVLAKEKAKAPAELQSM
ncbi:MFS transporter [Paenibacillus sp. YN15]|uniref:MFS transporter n=1 Tax=Paenibacillus sp. YN15 TaxID=1742774 RepID=UPI000DCB5A58|nr:MFS transporter [Paenibacillus sp. YN15]RAV02433.1 MFS transporter [Paenibacillus sp. YN15]